MTPPTFFAQLWDRLGIATTRDAVTRTEKITRGLERHEKRLERVNELLDQREKQASTVAHTVAELQATVAKLQRVVAAASDRADLLALARKGDLGSLDVVRGAIAQIEQDAPAIAAHAEHAIATACVSTDPFPHVVIDQLLPASFYDRALDALPPADFWQSSGHARDYWEIETHVGPWPTEIVWRFIDRQLVDQTLRPRLVEAFRTHLAEYWREGFGVDGDRVTYHTAEGRLQRRRKGYVLRPHLDPPHAALTGLFYLARPNDDPKYGTGLYKPSTSLPTRRRGIYYPEEHGITLESAVIVPFRANTLLVWMTSLGPHGADLTGSDVPKSIERYTYQFQLVIDDDTRRHVSATS